MFKNYSSCEKCLHEKCIHSPVCQYKFILKEIYDKIGSYWDNLAAPDIFRLALECKEYKDIETINKNNPYFA